MSEFNIVVVAVGAVLAVRSEFLRQQLARLLKRLKRVTVGVVSIEFERDGDVEPRSTATE